MEPLTLTCPSCQHRFDLLSGLQGAEQRDYLLLIQTSKRSSKELGLLFRYLALFKPLRNAMSYRALHSRTSELLTLITSGRVEVNKCVRVATPAAWWAAVEELVNNKPDTLVPPLGGHGYLKKMVFNAAENAAARAEAKDIESKRSGLRDKDTSSADTGPQSLASLMPKMSPPPDRDDATGAQGVESLREKLGQKPTTEDNHDDV